MTTTPRWLDAEERRAWLAYVEFSTLLSDHLSRQLRRDAGMTHSDYILLAHLSSVPQATLTMSELAERLKITRSRLTHAATRLQEGRLPRPLRGPREPAQPARRAHRAGPRVPGARGPRPRRGRTPRGLRRADTRAGTPVRGDRRGDQRGAPSRGGRAGRSGGVALAPPVDADARTGAAVNPGR